MALTATVDDYGESHETAERFGLRQVEVYPKASLKGASAFAVNGHDVFIRGGNVITPDGMLRNSEARCWAEVRLHAEAGFNMLRLWGGAGIPREAIYDACDHYGVLVWHEWWVTGDCNGRGATPASPESDPSWPVDHGLFVRSVRDVVLQLRNHPCLALWCGGNEQRPAPDLDAALRRIFGAPAAEEAEKAPAAAAGGGAECLDATRRYVSGSFWGGFAKGDGDWSDGPYGIQPPEAFFSDAFYAYGFNPEVGSVGTPSARAIRRMFPDGEGRDPPRLEEQAGQGVVDVPNALWQLHCYIPYHDDQGHNHLAAYGRPKDLDEFCDQVRARVRRPPAGGADSSPSSSPSNPPVGRVQAQLANYVQYRALLEGWAARMWTKYSGVLVWKTQNPWPGLRGALYDYWLDPLGSFFGAKVALQPLHAQLNPDATRVELVNASVAARTVDVAVAVYGLDGAPRGAPTTTARVEAAPQAVAAVPGAAYPRPPPGEVWFAFLSARDAGAPGPAARNVYWLTAPGRPTDLGALRPWARAATWRLGVRQRTGGGGGARGAGAGAEAEVRLELSNPHPTVLFWIKLQVEEAGSVGAGEPVAPAFFSDNSLTLAPGEALEVRVAFPCAAAAAAGRPVRLRCEGWNIEEAVIPLEVA